MKVSTESYKIISVTLEDGKMLLTLSCDDELSGIEWYQQVQNKKSSFFHTAL